MFQRQYRRKKRMRMQPQKPFRLKMVLLQMYQRNPLLALAYSDLGNNHSLSGFVCLPHSAYFLLILFLQFQFCWKQWFFVDNIQKPIDYLRHVEGLRNWRVETGTRNIDYLKGGTDVFVSEIIVSFVSALFCTVSSDRTGSLTFSSFGFSVCSSLISCFTALNVKKMRSAQWYPNRNSKTVSQNRIW